MPHPDEIRALVLKTFLELTGPQPAEAARDGAEPGAVAWGDLSETILIRGGAYYGRCYRAGGLVATLMAESQRLDFFDAQGRLLLSVALAAAPAAWQPMTQAA